MISKLCLSHVENSHKPLKADQIKALKEECSNATVTLQPCDPSEAALDLPSSHLRALAGGP